MKDWLLTGAIETDEGMAMDLECAACRRQADEIQFIDRASRKLTRECRRACPTIL